MLNRIDERIKLHEQYWRREPVKRPIVGFRTGDYFFSKNSSAARRLLVPGKTITADMIDVDLFVEDYANVCEEIEQTGQDAFYAVEPFVGFPWMEAICGCEVLATENSFVTEPYLAYPIEMDKIKLDTENQWYKKYMEFVSKLSIAFNNKNPVAQPIMRGALDVLGALIGQEELVYAIYDYPEETKALLSRITDIFLEIIQNQQDAQKPFFNGYSMGFYHLWCPGRCIWFQEDLTSLISPDHYSQFVYDLHNRICSGYDYTAIHLHPSSFYLLDFLLGMERLKVIEINKDIGGPSIQEMVPVFEKVQRAGKNLIIWGSLDYDDVDCLSDCIESRGVYLNIVAPDVLSAAKMMEYIAAKSWA